MGAYHGCRFCNGTREGGCLHCEEERANDAKFHGPKEPGAINVHLNDARDVEPVRREILRKTGQEPVICMHLYANSIEELREMLNIEPGEDRRRVSELERLIERSTSPRSYAPGRPVDSEELTAARMKVTEWARHSTNYAKGQVRHWESEVRRLEAERDGLPVPDDTAEDDDLEPPEEDAHAASIAEKPQPPNPPQNKRGKKTNGS